MKGHSGRDATWKKINQRFWFLGGEKWVRKKIRNCVACSHKNSSVWKSSKAPLRPITVFPKAFWRINLDLLGPIYPVSEQGNKYILLMIDPLTKYVEAAGNLSFFLSKDINNFFFTNSINDLFFLPREMKILFFLKKIQKS